VTRKKHATFRCRLPAICYLLSEDNQLKPQGIRNQLLLMAEIAYVSTLEEERVPLQILRSILAQCLEHCRPAT
jgi:hypothetical protein